MQTLLSAAFILLGFMPGALAAAGLEIPLSVANRSAMPRDSELAAGGVPLPRAAARDTAAFRVFDAAGKPLPAQFTVLNRWPTDGSIRWVLVQFPVALEGDGRAAFTLKTTGDAPAPVPRKRLQVKETAEYIVIDTGVMRLNVRKKGFNLFDSVVLLDGEEETPVAGPDFCADGFVIRTAKGESFSTARDAASKIALEDVGPLRATVRVEGRHKDAQGRALFDYQVRIYAAAGSRAVRVQYVFTDSDGKWPDGCTDLTQVGVTVRPKLDGPVIRSVIDPVQAYHRAGSTKDPLSLPMPPLAGARPQRFFEGTAVASARDAHGTGLAAAVRWFWQLRPKTIQVAPDGTLALNLIDARGPDDEPVYFYPGMSKTHDLLFHFMGPGESSDDELATTHFQQPLFVKPDPAWYCEKTLAFGRLVSADYKGYLPAFRTNRKAIDDAMAEQVRVIRKLREQPLDPQRGGDAFSVIHFGDGLHHVQGGGHRNVQWDNCQYAFTHMLALQYARTGDDLFLDTLREAVTFEGDIAVVWHKQFLGAPRPQPAAYHVEGIDPAGAFASETWELYNPVAMLELFHLTGDRRHEDAARTNLRWMLARGRTTAFNDPHLCGAALTAAVHGYLATGDVEYLLVARNTARQVLALFKTHGEYGTLANAYSMWAYALEGLCVYHDLTGDPALGKVLADIVKSHYRQPDWTYSLRFGYMNLYAAALAGDDEHRKTMEKGMATALDFELRTGEHAIKDCSQRKRSVPLMMWYLTDLAAKPTPWAGPIDLGPEPVESLDCPPIDPPTLDGKIDPAEWAKAAALSLVCDPNPRRKLEAPTRVRIAHDLKNLYIAVEATEPNMDRIAGIGTESGDPARDKDDCVEIYLSPVPRRSGVRLTVTAAGVRAVRRLGNAAADRKAPALDDFTVAAGKTKDSWTLELAVPLDKLRPDGEARPGAELGFNCIRFRTPEPPETSTWIGATDQIESTGTVVLK